MNAQFRQQVHEHVRHRHAADEGEPAAARHDVEKAQPAGQQM